MWETWAQSLGWEDPLEEGMATPCSILAWRIPMDGGAWWAAVHGVAESDTTEQLNTRLNHEDVKHLNRPVTNKETREVTKDVLTGPSWWHSR